MVAGLGVGSFVVWLVFFGGDGGRGYFCLFWGGFVFGFFCLFVLKRAFIIPLRLSQENLGLQAPVTDHPL